MVRRTAIGSKKEEEKKSGLRRDDVIMIFIIVAFALAIGALGYYYTTQLDLLDSFYNASLILSGMGPANSIETVGGKYFAAFYAIFSGFVFIVVITVFISRIIGPELA